MNESKIELTERLRREGRWKEVSLKKDEKVKSLRDEGMSRRKATEAAWQWLADEYPPVVQTLLTDFVGTEPDEMADGIEETDDSCPSLPPGNHWEALNWVADALGQLAAGKKVQLSQAPNDAAVGVFSWARTCPEKFYSLWTGEGRRREVSGVDKKRAAKKQVREIEQMLDNVLIEAKRIEHEAANRAKVKVEAENNLFGG